MSTMRIEGRVLARLALGWLVAAWAADLAAQTGPAIVLGDAVAVQPGETATLVIQVLDEAGGPAQLTATARSAPDWLVVREWTAGPSRSPRLEIEIAPPAGAEAGVHELAVHATNAAGFTSHSTLSWKVLPRRCSAARYEEEGVCRDCPPNHIPNDARTGCAPCPPGTERLAEEPECEPCPPGLSSDAGGSCGCGLAARLSEAGCVACPPDTDSRRNARNCDPCPPGQRRPAGVASCRPVPPGQPSGDQARAASAKSGAPAASTPTLALSASVSELVESAAAQPVTVAATLSVPAAAQLTVALTFGGTASAADYSVSGTRAIAIAAGASSATTTLRIVATNDLVADGGETIEIGAALAGYAVAKATLTLREPAGPLLVVRVDATQPSSACGGGGRLCMLETSLQARVTLELRNPPTHAYRRCRVQVAESGLNTARIAQQRRNRRNDYDLLPADPGKEAYRLNGNKDSLLSVAGWWLHVEHDGEQEELEALTLRGRCGGSAQNQTHVDLRWAPTTVWIADVPWPKLTVARPSGGRVSGEGIDCTAGGTGRCEKAYAVGSLATLTATADAHHRFAGWGGACAGTAAVCTVAVDADKAVSAEFAATSHLLTVVRPEDGRVAGPGIDCGAGTRTDCEERQAAGATVRLTAVAAPNRRLLNWTGACAAASGSTCDVLMDAAKTVGAEFGPVRRRLLVSPHRLGNVAGPGIDCGGAAGGGDCVEEYDHGTQVALTATANDNHVFASWSGCDEDASAACTVTMDRPRAVGAAFVRARRTLAVDQRPANGYLTTKGVDCGSGGRDDCEESKPHGTYLVVRATADEGYEFASWSGACSGEWPKCQVKLDRDLNVGVAFAPKPCAAQTSDSCVLPETASGAAAGACASGHDGACSYSCSLGEWSETSNTCSPQPCSGQTSDHCVLPDTASGASAGSCASGYAGACQYACGLGEWSETSNTCSPQPCSGQTSDHCVLPDTASGASAGACASGYAGACEYSCSLGGWSETSNTCSPKPCSGQTSDHCVLPDTASGASAGSCAAGYAGACEYACGLGEWSETSNTCSPQPCSGQTSDHCVLPDTASGASAGSCAAGYAGACEYACGLGEWSETSNTCSPQPCSGQTSDHCVLPDTASGVAAGSCASGYDGACEYACGLGEWSETSNTCSPQPCSGQTSDHCVLPDTTSGASAGTCAAGYAGACEYACGLGEWSKTSNTCSPQPCSGQTSDHCVLPDTASGASAGSCASGYAGACEYACGLGEWSETSNTCSPKPCAGQTSDHCVLPDTASGAAAGTCASGYAGACEYACGLGEWSETSNTCSPKPCSGQTSDHCDLPDTASGASAGACASGYDGACAYACGLGEWSETSNTCSPKPCAGQTSDHCDLPETASGASAGACASGYDGACAYACGLGEWSETSNTCSPKPCSGQTSDHCVLPDTASGASAGKCASGYDGACAYACGLGEWSETSNTCSPKPCAGQTSDHCALPDTASGDSAGKCASGYAGACAYACGLGEWSETSNTCSPKPCTAQTIDHCDLPDTTSGASAGKCAARYNGACEYSCSLGGWSKAANTCLPNPQCASERLATLDSYACAVGAYSHPPEDTYSIGRCDREASTPACAVGGESWSITLSPTDGECSTTKNTCKSGRVAGKPCTTSECSWDCLGSDGSQQLTCVGTAGKWNWSCTSGQVTVSDCSKDIGVHSETCGSRDIVAEDASCKVCNTGYEECKGSCVAKCGDNAMRNPATCGCDCNTGYEKCKGSCVAKCGDNAMRNPTTCGCDCNTGYEECNGSCVAKCGDNAMRNPATCGCDCNTGYEKCKGSCVAKCGDNAMRNPTTCGCDCNTGYEKCGSSCVAKCGDNAMRNPATCGCDCNTGYEKCNGSCVAKCGANATRNARTCNCDCDAGYQSCTPSGSAASACYANCGANATRNARTCNCDCDAGYQSCTPSGSAASACYANCGANATRNTSSCDCDCDPGYEKDDEGNCVPPECSDPLETDMCLRGSDHDVDDVLSPKPTRKWKCRIDNSVDTQAHCNLPDNSCSDPKEFRLVVEDKVSNLSCVCKAGYVVDGRSCKRLWLLEVTRPSNGYVTGTGISCGADARVDCTELHPNGTSVTLTASPGANRDVVWAGCDSHTRTTCKVTMDGAKTVTPTFPLKQRTLAVTPPSNGRIAGQGINCGSGGRTDCTEQYDHGTSVTLTASPGANRDVVWAGCDSHTGTTCKVTMDGAKTVTPTFPLKQRTLAVTPPSNGRIAGEGIDCGSGDRTNCTEQYDHGTEVELTATADDEYALGSWSGCTASGATCTVRMNRARATVAATFALVCPSTCRTTAVCGGREVCKCPGASCPSGYAQHRNCSRTSSTACSGDTDGCGRRRHGSRCTVAGRSSFSDVAQEFCLYEHRDRNLFRCSHSTRRCLAAVVEIGCVKSASTTDPDPDPGPVNPRRPGPGPVGTGDEEWTDPEHGYIVPTFECGTVPNTCDVAFEGGTESTTGYGVVRKAGTPAEWAWECRSDNGTVRQCKLPRGG